MSYMYAYCLFIIISYNSIITYNAQMFITPFAYIVGHSPYPDIEIQAWEHFIQFLKDGNRPPLPSGCPENM